MWILTILESNQAYLASEPFAFLCVLRINKVKVNSLQPFKNKAEVHGREPCNITEWRLSKTVTGGLQISQKLKDIVLIQLSFGDDKRYRQSG